jgi:hypothetical protein
MNWQVRSILGWVRRTQVWCRRDFGYGDQADKGEVVASR